ncbi:MAG: glycogen synthase GlgA [bacterium]|nr:MAG: glycogen synthase GlgA [bacterium]
MLSVLMIAAEAAPYAKVGGLGDVAGTLPKRLAERGLKVSVYLPYYSQIRESGREPEMMDRHFTLRHAGKARRVRVGREVSDGVDFFFIEEATYFRRDGIYGPHGGDFPDNAQRYSFLVRAALAAAASDRLPDLIHCHDWHGALAPVYLSYGDAAPGWRSVPTILTIHNLAHQGVFDAGIFPDLGLPARAYAPDCLEHFGSVNFLKAGILKADYVTTVSPTYAREITGPELGFGLDGVLAARGGRLVGIANGIDYETWNPRTDLSLPVPFDGDQLEARERGKNLLREELRLDPQRRSPLFTFVGRLVHQKGADLLAGIIPGMVDNGLQISVLGSGQREIEDRFRMLAGSHPGRVSVTIGFDEPLSRRLYAGSDFFVMPSRFEPCGLGQMIAMRYGCLPVVRRTGGLVDTVFDLSADPEGGNGFVFDGPGEIDLREAVTRAARFFRTGDREAVIKRIMALDNSWRHAAGLYLDLYRKSVRAAPEGPSKEDTDDG